MTDATETAAVETEAVDPAVAAAATGEEPPRVEETPESNGDARATIATGAEEGTEPETKPYWPEDWRQKFANHAAAGDAKLEKKLLNQLDRYVDPAAIFSKTRELESRFSEGGLVKVPGKDASEEDVAEFHKMLGVPEKPEDYFENIQLENGAVIGEMDKPIADGFAAAVHEAGATPAVVNKAMNWYFGLQEEQAAALDEADETFRNEARMALKEEFGNAFQRYTNSVGSLFATAPGGSDVTAEGSLYGRLMGGRMRDGRMIGDDPDMIRFLVGVARELKPRETVTEGGDQSGMGLEAELEQLRELRKTDLKKYYSDEIQARELEIIDALQKDRARA